MRPMFVFPPSSSHTLTPPSPSPSPTLTLTLTLTLTPSPSNYCENITCLNNGVCHPSLLNYTCQCVDESYSGRYCEIISNQVVVRQTVSKSFAYIAIIAMAGVVMFFVTLDVFKYFFGIDPIVKEFRRRKQKIKTKKKKPSVIIRYTYVNTPSTQSSETTISTVEEITV
jgi:hypothetical protein